MAINKKNKRRLLVEDREYLWWVFDEYDQTAFDGIQVKIVSADQTHFFKYGLQQLEEKRKVVFSLRDYTKLVHLSSPKFENKDGIITNSGINRLIQWCKNETHEIRHVMDGKYKEMTENEKHMVLRDIQKILF